MTSTSLLSTRSTTLLNFCQKCSPLAKVCMCVGMGGGPESLLSYSPVFDIFKLFVQSVFPYYRCFLYSLRSLVVNIFSYKFRVWLIDELLFFPS